MKVLGLLFLYFIFILYYIYTLYVFKSLQSNPCNCAKLEKFKQTWNFKYIIVMSSILLISNLYLAFKLLNKAQTGGSLSSLYNFTLLFLCFGFGLSFLNDYAILDLFNTMEIKNCPCNVDNRKYLTNATRAKFVLNLMVFISSISFMNTSKFNKLLKTLKKKSNKKL